jgi:TRAP-type C4-dicarboxylate transport system permease small subunit
MSYQNTLSKTKREEEKRKFYPFWRYLGEIALEPLVLAFAIFLLFAHIQQITTVASNFSEFWQMLNEDLVSNMWAYIFFGFIFAVWVTYRLLIKTWEFRDREETKRLNTEMLEILRGIKEELKNKR